MPDEVPSSERPHIIPTAQMELYILAILITDQVNGPILYNKLITTDYKWDQERKKSSHDIEISTAKIAEATLVVYHESGIPIGMQLIKDIFAEEKPDSLISITIKEIEKRIDIAQQSADVVLAQVDRHVRLQKNRVLVDQAQAAIMLGHLEEVDQIVSELQNSIPQARQRTVIEMVDPAQAFSFMDEEEDPCSRMVIPLQSFMDRNVTLRRKRVLTFMAKWYGGKSTFIRDCLYGNLRLFRALHYSLETGDRPNAGYLMKAFRLTRDPFRRDSPELTPVKLPRLTKQGNQVQISHEVALFDCLHNQRRQITDALRDPASVYHQLFNNLTIICVPPDRLTMAMVRQELERGIREGRPYSIVAIDYLDKCRMRIREAADKRLETIRITQEFQALCFDYDVAGITGSQLNKAGQKSNDPDASDGNESADKAMIGDDIIISYQDKKMEKDGVARLKCDKTRGRKGKFYAWAALGWDIGQYCLSDVIVDDEDAVTFSIQEGSIDEQILNVLRSDLTQTNATVAAALNVTADRVGRVALAFLTTEEKAQRGERRGGARPRTRIQ